MKLVTVIFALCIYLVVQVHAAAGPDCTVVPMIQWAGEESQHTAPLLIPDLVIIQDTFTQMPFTDQSCEAMLRAIRKYQIEKLGYDDIAASFFVCGNGKVYEGAGWGMVGASAAIPYNSRAIAISFVGNYDTVLPSAATLRAARKLIACGLTMDYIRRDFKLVGLRQVSNIVSPGDALQNEIETWPHWTNSV